MIKYLSIFTGFALLSGCAVFNPYASDFTCPGSAKGKCVSVNAAYKESTVTTSAPAEDSAKSNDLNEEDSGKAEDEICSQHVNSDDPANTSSGQFSLRRSGNEKHTSCICSFCVGRCNREFRRRPDWQCAIGTGLERRSANAG